MSVAAGSLIDHYRVEGPVGSGAFATVYLAHDDRFDDVVAVKVLAENRSLDIDARRRFIEEAQKLRAVRSPSVVTVFDVGETQTNQPYMVLEFADRGDLAARRAQINRAVTPAEIHRVVDFLTDALAALHLQGLVHRDVKPHNVLLATRSPSAFAATLHPPAGALIAADERLLLGDLGFVKDLAAASGYTVGGGTAAFRAPEQAAALGTIDHRADIFAASALVLWLITGEAPSESSGWEQILANSAAGIPPELAAALSKGLAADPNARQPTIEAWQAELAASLGPQAQAIQALRRSRRWPMAALLAGLAIAALAAVAGVGWYALSEGRVTSLVEDGVATTEQRVGSSTVSIVGPAEPLVGQPAVFRVEVDGAASTWWVEGNGSAADSAPERTFVPRSEGRFRVVVIVAEPGEDPAIVIHEAFASQP